MKKVFYKSQNRINIKLLLLFCLVSFYTFSADGLLSLRVNQSFLSGSANEIVYRDLAGNKLSELNWGIKDVKLIGIGASYGPISGLSINTDFYINYNEGTSEMDDYDWLDYSRADWTHFSNSPTDITQVYKFDLNTEYTLLSTDLINLFVTLGYKADTFKWVAVGGTYIYSDDDGGNFRAYQGSFPNEPGISYNQSFKCSYIGLGSKINLGSFSLEGKLNYSAKVEVKGEDTHHFRDLYFEDYFSNGELIQLNLQGNFILNDNMTLIASYDYTKYFLNKGYTVSTDLITGVSSTSGFGGAGIENYSTMINLGFKYIF